MDLEKIIKSFEQQIEKIEAQILECPTYQLEKLGELAHMYRTDQEYYFMLTGHYHKHHKQTERYIKR